MAIILGFSQDKFLQSEEEISLFQVSLFVWTYIKDGEWSIEDDEHSEVVIYPKLGGYIAVLYKRQRFEIELINKPLPLQTCVKAVEWHAKNYMDSTCSIEHAKWKQNKKCKPTLNQKILMRSLGIYSNGLSIYEATNEITKFFAFYRKRKRNGNIYYSK